MPVDEPRRLQSRGDNLIISQCASCQRKQAGASACAAFPGGIPLTILTNQLDHRKAVEGDQGLQFLAKEGNPGDFRPMTKGA